eukprot:9530993-Ditylum_brightwellii.AAC.1
MNGPKNKIETIPTRNVTSSEGGSEEYKEPTKVSPQLENRSLSMIESLEENLDESSEITTCNPQKSDENLPRMISLCEKEPSIASSTEVSQLVDLVRNQMDLVRTLTTAQIQSSAELKRLQEEKYRSKNNDFLCRGDMSNVDSNFRAPPIDVVPENSLPPPLISPYKYCGNVPPSSIVAGFSNKHKENYSFSCSHEVPYEMHEIQFQDNVAQRPDDTAMKRFTGNIEEGYKLNIIDSCHNNVFSTCTISNKGALQKSSYTSTQLPKNGKPWGIPSCDNFIDGSHSHELSAFALNPAPPPRKRKETAASRCWRSFARLCTFLIPEKCIMRGGYEAKQAWREKVAIFIVMIVSSVIFVGVGGFVPIVLCKETHFFTMNEIWDQHKEAWTVIHGKIYDVKNYIEKHPGGSNAIRDFLGSDASRLFPRTPAAHLPLSCLDIVKNPPNISACSDMPSVDRLVGIPCHNYEGVNTFFSKYERGTLAFSAKELQQDKSTDWITIRGRVYN